MKSFHFSFCRSALILIMMIAAMFLSACTANTGSTDERGLLPHLSVDLQLPTEMTPGSTGQFRIYVSQDGKPVQADKVTFGFWPVGHSEQRVEIAGVSEGNGLYSAEYRLGSEGVYVVRCRVSSGSLEVMPARRFAIGEEAVLRLAALERQQNAETPASGGGGHHH